MNFSDILLKSFSENFKQLTKMTEMNPFSILVAFFMKFVGFCTVFIADMNPPCNKYRDTCIFIEFADKAQSPPILSKADLLKNVKNSNFFLYFFFSI